MGPDRISGASGPRVGLVLGAGGVLGAAWMTGALAAMQARMPCPMSDVDMIVGTSAGSVLAAALRCRVGVDDLIAFQRGEAAGVLQDHVNAVDSGPLPPPPQLRVGSPRLMAASLLTPHRVHPWVGASAWLPRGRARHAGLRSMVDVLHRHAHQSVPPFGVPPAWVADHTWIVAVDYDSGRRVVFGREGAPPARLADAVAASCSIPGWFEPVVIGGRRYVDGGIRSATSLGVLASAGLDEIYVLAPMASVVTDHPRKPHERIERRLRRLITMALLREARSLRDRGIAVTILTPGPQDLAVMGLNLMDPRRRLAVLETSLRTSELALAGKDHDQPRAA
ncbi:MAG TPA: patatin-like phospholipase family protein [Streptosporangiaceae bacterium]|nr:patatin-like phospholipase family protein [Streptosporangiaceae bacterium]